MRILYICDKLITFILNEIIELKKNNDIFILSEHNELFFNVINRPILIENGLEKNYYRFCSYKNKNRRQRYLYFANKLIYDLFVHPRYTIKCIIHILKNYSNPKYGFLDYLDIRNFFALDIDIIHSPFSTPRVIDKVYLLSTILDLPFTLCFRAHDIYEGNNFSEAQKRIDAISAASQIITIANYNKKHIKNTIDIDKGVEVIHSAINLDLFRPYDTKKSSKSIIAVSRLHEQKGLVHLINACHILNNRKIDFECTIIGEGPEKKVYDKLIEELQIPNIRFIDYMSYDEIRNHLGHSTVFVLPCVIASDGKRDILANALKEAMAMQVPVITSKINGIEELVDDGVNGILVSPGDPELIADAIENIFNNPVLGNYMGQEGRKKVEKEFNIKIEIRKLENVFKKVSGRVSARERLEISENFNVR